MPGVSNTAGSRPQVTAVVLAGGMGRRMGGADKGLLVYQGRPLIEWVLAAVTPQVDAVVISANRNLEDYARYGHRVLADAVPGFAGPLAGVLAALDAVETEWLLVVPCDTPHLPTDLALRLLGEAQLEEVPLAVAEDAARVHHTCFIVHAEQREELARYLARGEHAVHRWQAQLGSARVRFDAAGFVNLNEPGDLRR